MNNNIKKENSALIYDIIANIATWFISAGFIMWGMEHSCSSSKLPSFYLLGNLFYAHGSILSHVYNLAKKEIFLKNKELPLIMRDN